MRRGDVGRAARERGRPRDARAGLVGARTGHAADDGDVVLRGVVRAGVVALAPLADRVVVADAHDRRPRAVAAVVALGRVPVVVQAEVVAHLVRDRLGDVLRRVAELVREHPGRLHVAVAVAGGATAVAVDRVEDVDVRHPAAATADRVVRTDARGDQDVRAEGLVGSVRAEDPGRAGVGGRHVDVEGRVVLGDRLPDGLDLGQLGVVEPGSVAGRVPGGLGGGRRGVVGVPGRAARRTAVEVEVDGALGEGLAVQQEGLVERCLRADRVDGRRDGDLVLVEDEPIGVEPGGRVGAEHLDELRLGHVVERCGLVELVAQQTDRGGAADGARQLDARGCPRPSSAHPTHLRNGCVRLVGDRCGC